MHPLSQTTRTKRRILPDLCSSRLLLCSCSLLYSSLRVRQPCSTTAGYRRVGVGGRCGEFRFRGTSVELTRCGRFPFPWPFLLAVKFSRRFTSVCSVRRTENPSTEVAVPEAQIRSNYSPTTRVVLFLRRLSYKKRQTIHASNTVCLCFVLSFWWLLLLLSFPSRPTMGVPCSCKSEAKRLFLNKPVITIINRLSQYVADGARIA